MEKLTVIKVGGKIVEEEESLQQLLKDFSAIEGYKVLVHGGGRSATKIAAPLGIESQMVNGRRITDAEMLNRKLALLARGVDKQRQVLMWITNFLGNDAFRGKSVLQKVVLEKVPTTATVVKTLVRNGFLIEDFEDALQPSQPADCQSKHELNQYQQTAIEQIRAEFEGKQTVLLHGITGCGKTEIYIHLIDEMQKALEGANTKAIFRNMQ